MAQQTTEVGTKRLRAAFEDFLLCGSVADRLLLASVLEEAAAIAGTDDPAHGLALVLPEALERAAHGK